MKGKSIIELTNIKDGSVRRYENTNLITDAVPNRLSTWSNIYSREFLTGEVYPLYDKMFGGILLFDNYLEENIYNTNMPDPSVAKLIGYSGNKMTNGNDPKRGSRNLTESKIETLPSGKARATYVYDFNTNEGNGTIKSLSLTHQANGYYGERFSYYDIMKGTSNTSTYNVRMNNSYLNMSQLVLNNKGVVEVEKINNGIENYFIMTGVYLTNDGNTVTIYKKKFSNNTIGLDDTPTSSSELLERVNIPISINADIKYKYRIDTFKSDENYYYAFYDTYNSTTKTELYYIRINKENHNIEQGKINVPYLLVSIYSDGFNLKDIDKRLPYEVRDNKAYFYINKSDVNTPNQRNILRIDFNNDKEQSIINVEPYEIYAESKLSMYKNPNGTIVLNNGIIDKDDNYYYTINFKSGFGYYQTDSSASGGFTIIRYADEMTYMLSNSLVSDKYIIHPNIQYLGTINNLSEPIVKTNEETMKITYILEEADE